MDEIQPDPVQPEQPQLQQQPPPAPAALTPEEQVQALLVHGQALQRQLAEQQQLLAAAHAEVANLRAGMQQAMQQSDRRKGGPKLQKPQPWDGKSDFDRGYRLPTLSYLNYYNIANTEEGVYHASHLLPEPYLSTYQAHRQRPDVQQPQTFDELCALIKTWHPQVDRLEMYMRQMEALKCKPGGLAEYNREFTQLLMEVHPYNTNYWVKYRYAQGLTNQIRHQIDGFIKLKESSLEEIIALATSTESRLLNLKDARSSNNTYYKPSFPKHSYASSSSSSGPTPMEINRATFKGICYKCDKPGHRAADCTAPPSEQRHNRRQQHPAAAAPHRPGQHRPPWQSKK
jgi:hypothetical protein